MSRQQFLAELTQYLTFVTPQEREQIIAVFEEKFDSVGAEGETALLMELGTPMSIAIAFKRRKEAGELIVQGTPSEEQPGEPSVAEPPLAEEPPAAEIVAEAVPEPEASIAGPANERPEAARPAAQSDAGSIPEPPDAEIIFEPDIIVEEIPAISSDGTAKQIEIEEPAPRKILSAGAAIGTALLSVVVAAILLIPAAAGGYLVVIMANFIFGALRTMSATTDALWMFALGFAAGAIGILVLWFFLWAMICLIRRMFYGKPATKSGFRLGMKKAWKVIWIVFAILLAAGIVCGVIGFSMGGSPNDLFDNDVSVTLFDWLSGNAVANLFTKIFG